MAKTAPKAKKRKPKSYRMMFRFWLDGNKNEELALADYCEELKHKRSFASTMRDAIRLIQDLRQQRLDVLFQLFPWINAWLEERAEAIAAAKTRPSGGDDGNGNIIDLAAQIQRLEALLLQQHTTSGGLLMLAKQEQLRALPAPRSAPDMEDTSLINITKMTGGGGDVTHNFLKSMSFISGVDFAADTSPAPPKSKRSTSKQKPAKTVAAPVTGGIKTLAVPQLAAPSFDDMDDGLSLFG